MMAKWMVIDVFFFGWNVKHNPFIVSEKCVLKPAHHIPIRHDFALRIGYRQMPPAAAVTQDDVPQLAFKRDQKMAIPPVGLS